MKRLAVVLALVAFAPRVEAGGMYLPTKGVRATARGGAFVAGVDDLGGLGYNPAGLASLAGGEGHQVFLDLGFVSQSVTYTRIDSGNNIADPVTNESPGLPIPTMGLSFDVGEDLVVAVGVHAPYASLAKYPVAGPQRYSLVDMSESLLVVAELSVGWKVNDGLRVGVGVQNMFSHIASTMVASGCPGETICAPEDPEFDSLSQMQQTDLASPSAIAGVQFDVGDKLTLAGSVQLPFNIGGTGTLTVRLPSSGFFEGAEVVGDEASMSMTLPAIFRAGLQVRPARYWVVEFDVDYEMWSMQDEIKISPKDVRITDVPGVGTYEVGDMTVPRNMEDTVAVMGGFEGRPSTSVPLTVSGGYAYETAASPDEFLSVLTVDGAKHMITGGLGYSFGKTRVSTAFAFVAVQERTIDSDTAQLEPLSPIRDEPVEASEVQYINAGTYQSSWFVLGAGVSREF